MAFGAVRCRLAPAPCHPSQPHRRRGPAAL